MENLRARAARPDRPSACAVNVGDMERTISAVAGGFILLRGLSRLSLSTILGAVAGGALLYRGLTGHCCVYQALDVARTHGLGHNEHDDRRAPRHTVTDASLAATGESP
jgi:uncharacterized membrane protein